MQLKKLNLIILRIIITLVIFTGIDSTFCGLNYASDRLQPKIQYRIIRPVYLMAVYNNPNNQQLNKNMARAYLVAKQHNKEAEVAFQCKVSEGTIMTIIGPAPKSLPFFFVADQYFVQLKPDISRGLDIILVLNRGIEGDLNGLNPEIFTRLE